MPAAAIAVGRLVRALDNAETKSYVCCDTLSKRGVDVSQPEEVIELHGIGLEGVPDVPPARLDPYLDAAATCFARFGVTRTRVPDIAAEAGVSRVTIYRQLGATEDIARLLLARDLHRMLEAVPARLGGRDGLDAVVGLIEHIVETARSHAVLAKVLADEPQVLGPLLVRDFGSISTRIADVVSPLLDALMADGQLARRDSKVLAEWLVRQTATLVLAPPPGALDEFLRELLEPALRPAATEP